MKFGFFIMGGIVGAAAAVYMNRNKGMMMFSMDKMFGKAKSNFSSVNKSSDMVSKSPDLSKVNEIVNNDTHLKDKVNEIIAENDRNSGIHQMQ